MSDRIPLAGVLGAPVSHSLSPRLHNHWLRKYGLRGYYVPLEVAQKDFERVLRTLPAMGFVGANVTIPHKEAALNLADQVTDRASLMGAANTLIFQPDGRIHADNTDGYGFMANLRQNAPGWDPTSGPAVVFGAGGAARAVVMSLLEAGVPELRLTNRTRTRADALREEFGSRIKVVDWVHAGELLDGAATVVNATSLGMSGKSEFKVSLDRLDPDAVVNDIVYVPLITPFLQAAADRGARIVDGLGMLLHQGTPGFARWFGQEPVVDEDIRQAVLAP